MFENIKKIFKKSNKANEISSKSKEAAKERLHLVLMQDRANVSVDFLELMKQEIIDVIKKYIEVDDDAIDVRLTNKENEDGTNGAPALYANIPIINIKNEAKKEIEKEENKVKAKKIEETKKEEYKVKKSIDNNDDEKSTYEQNEKKDKIKNKKKEQEKKEKAKKEVSKKEKEEQVLKEKEALKKLEELGAVVRASDPESFKLSEEDTKTKEKGKRINAKK